MSSLFNFCRNGHTKLGLKKLFQCCNYSAGTPPFKPQKILILTKLSRYDFERHRHWELTEAQLEKKLIARGSDFNLILCHHYIHKGIETAVHNVLSASGIETKVVNRLEYTDDLVDWADAIITTGGDGTFLLAATKITNNKKPLIGFNSDPIRSKGHLCLPSKYSANVKAAVNMLLNGKFRWTYRNRIRVTLIGKDAYKPPIELHKQELENHENRYLDIGSELYENKENSSLSEERFTLPFLALNEVFIGECVSARVSYLEFGFDSGEHFKQKCSGFIVSTGTGSTSWTYNVNRLTEQTMEDILAIVKEDTKLPVPHSNEALVLRLTNKFNQTLIIDPDEGRMVYTIRDMLPVSPFSKCSVKPRGFSRRISVKSRCFDACLAVDGGVSYPFNDGMRAIFEMQDVDALKTVSFLNESISFKH